MKAELITIGDEILLGRIINTNTACIGARLAKIGIRLDRQTAIPDENEALREAFNEALTRCDVVIATGGLGPTSDDRTKILLAERFRTRLVRDEDIAKDLLTRFGEQLPGLVLTQADVPESASVIPNPVGTAPGFFFTEGSKKLFALPGPPNELKPMLESFVIPKLEEAREGGLFTERVCRTIGIRESEIEEKVREALSAIPGLSYGLIAHPYQVDIRLFCTCATREEAGRILDQGEQVLDSRFGDAIFTKDDRSLEEVIGEILRRKGKTIALAESCTGGLISKRITDIPGSSAYFEGGFVSYSNRWKQNLLGVSAQTLIQTGAVSENTAKEMAENVRERAGADIGLSVTGIAGPSGGTEEKPVGLVCMAIADRRKTRVAKHLLRGDREHIRYRASQVALNMIRECLLEEEPD